MLDSLVPQVEAMRDEGAVVLLKWDGERARHQATVVVTRPPTDYLFHRDGPELATLLQHAILDYRAHFPTAAP
jgi:hypothetical protein